MCKAIVVLAALLMIPLGASLDGQSIRPSESELVDRLDSLSVILLRADSVAKIADAARTEERRRLLTALVDTFQVGPFVVVARVREVELARRYFEQAWARYASTVGTEPTSLEGRVFIFSKGDPLRGLDGRGAMRVSTRFMPTDRVRGIGSILGGVISDDLPDDLRIWVDKFLIRPDPRSELESAYRSLVRTASAAVMDCYDGALDRCWDAMGLDHRDEWATAWYTAFERRAFVRRFIRSSNGLADGILSNCLDDESNEACTALLVERGAAASIPLPPRARMTLVTHALSLGGGLMGTSDW